MRSERVLLAVAFCTWPLTAWPVTAANVEFTQTLTNTCTLAVPTPGVLGLSTDGLTLGSEEGIGTAATVTVLSIGANTVTVEAPSRTSGAPTGYNTATETVEVRYVGLGGLSTVTQGYTSAQTSFAVNTLPLTSITMHNRIVNSEGFADGTYTTQTVVTCS